jgi:hypothetical protein
MWTKFKVHANLISITDTLHEYLCAFMELHRRILLKMRNTAEELVEKIKRYIFC